MAVKKSKEKPIGVIGAGSFGTVVSNLIAYNADVLLHSRSDQVVEKINTTHKHIGVDLSKRIVATSDLERVANECDLIFPVVPSHGFRKLMKALSPYLRPYHILIHGTKGIDINEISYESLDDISLILTREQVSTMSEVIAQESVVLRIGCLSGPNLAKEIMEGQPTATVIGSKYDEVISWGKRVLRSRNFHVFGNHDILGAEMAGALKNIIAIGSGVLGGKGLGKNIQAMLITRGLMEMIYFGKAMGATSGAFFGTAGIGDLVATATSTDSRNYSFGMRLGRGEDIATIQSSMPELAEGVRALKIAKHLALGYKLHVPITDMLYKIVFEGYNVDKAMTYLMAYPYDVDVDFL